jgi:hypothetical protein
MITPDSEDDVADVTVFVDDAVLGRLPSVCAKDGTYTDDRLTVSQELGGSSGLGITWLLFLVGPVGWLVLIVMSSMRRSGGMLTVTLSFSQAAYERLVRHRRKRWPWGIIAIVVGFVTVEYLVSTSGGNHQSLIRALLGVVGGIVAFVCLFGWMASVARFRKAKVDMDLDASRRWVTLSGVHPNFAAAVHQNLESIDSR